MIRSALLLCAAILAAACSGCIAATPPPDSVTTLSATCRDGAPFLSRVRFVQNGWLPDTRHPDDPPPMLGAPLELGSAAVTRASWALSASACVSASISVT